MLSFAGRVFLTSVFGLGPCPDATKETCLRGGMTSAPCTGMSCPPCWLPQDDKTWGCYEKYMGTGQSATCPPWAGIVDITTLPSNCAIPANPTKPPVPIENIIFCPNVTEDVCFRGGYRAYPCKGKSCPRCWEYKNMEWDCYDPINGQCEWDNLVDIQNLPANCEMLECE